MQDCRFNPRTGKKNKPQNLKARLYKVEHQYGGQTYAIENVLNILVSIHSIAVNAMT
jgi:hypothetical protein